MLSDGHFKLSRESVPSHVEGRDLGPPAEGKGAGEVEMDQLRDFKVTMLLADAAQHVSGKLYVLGAGWSVINPGTVMFAVAVYIQTAWSRANVQHEFRLELLDADGVPVLMEAPDGSEVPVALDGGFFSPRPADVKPGTPLDGGFAWNLAIALPADSRLGFRMSINGESHPDWTLPFTTRPTPIAQAA